MQRITIRTFSSHAISTSITPLSSPTENQFVSKHFIRDTRIVPNTSTSINYSFDENSKSSLDHLPLNDHHHHGQANRNLKKKSFIQSAWQDSPVCTIVSIILCLIVSFCIASTVIALVLIPTRVTTSKTTTTLSTCFVNSPSLPSDNWLLIGNMSFARQQHTATLLPQDQSVFITGGYNGSRCLSSTEKYITMTGCFNQTGNMLRPRYAHTADQLPTSSGLIAIVGGLSPSTLNVAHLFDPFTGNTTLISMSMGRFLHTSVLVNHSKLILIGGLTINTIDTADSLNVSAPSSFTLLTSPMTRPRHGHTTTSLGSNSDVFLVTGGLNVWTPQSSIELYNASSNTFFPLSPTMPTSRYYHTATYIPSSNQVLIAGGSDGSITLNTMVVFDVNTTSFISISNRLVHRRMYHTATLLPTGKILLVGGSNSTTSLSSCELIDPNNGNYSSILAAELHTDRYYHTATLISTSGRNTVLICGGHSTSLGTLNSCELYFV